MIFTDEDGKKYEESGEFGATVNDQRHFVIRPIEEPKIWEVSIKNGDKIDIYFYDYYLSEGKVELIKEAVDVLMGCILSDDPLTDEYLINRVREARKALQS